MPAPVLSPSRPWGLWVSLLLSLLLIIIYNVLQVAAISVYTMLQNPHLSATESEWLSQAITQNFSNGFAVAIALCVTAVFGLGAVAIFILFRRDISLRDYLLLYPVQLATLIKWLGATSGFIVVVAIAAVLTNQPWIHDYILTLYTSAGFLPLLWFAIIIAAPVFEEILFRGFLFEGICYSRLGPLGAVLLTSLLWTAIHTQYDWFYLSVIFCVGLLFGYARLRTASLYTVIAMHIFFNLVAMIEMEVYLRLLAAGKIS